MLPSLAPSELPPVFSVGPVPIYGDLILAPMDGYSDLPFRVLCRELGSAMSYTEFINALDILQGNPFVARKLEFLPQEQPVVYQIFDSDPDRLVEVALRLVQREPAIIDINLGCSDKHVSGRGAGAGLLRTPLKIARIFRKVTRVLKIPVTAKIRLGWDDQSRNFKLVARIIEENGGALIAVHGRTRQQAYHGQADWDAIAEVRQAVSIPVIANGDVNTVADIARIKEHTGCPAVMIGRGAVSNPWIFSRLDRDRVSIEMVWRTLLRHLQLNQSFYGPERGLVFLRKYANRYLRLTSLPVELRQQVLTVSRTDDFLALIKPILVETH